MGQDCFVLILGREAGVCEVTVYVTPFAKTAIVEGAGVIVSLGSSD